MSEQTNLAARAAYGTHHIQRGTDVPDPDRLTWGFWPTGSGAKVLGDTVGRRVLDLGSGLGKYASCLAREHCALVDASRSPFPAPARHRLLRPTAGPQPCLRSSGRDPGPHAGHSAVGRRPMTTGKHWDWMAYAADIAGCPPAR